MKRTPLRAAAARAVIAAAALLALPACGPDPRPSAAGESCARTADCADPLRCVDRACVTPAQAAHLLAPAAPDGTGGAPPDPAPTAPRAPLGRGLAPTPQPAPTEPTPPTLDADPAAPPADDLPSF